MTSYANPPIDPRQIAKTPLDVILEVLAILALAINLMLIATSWHTLPERIPHHFDFAGNPDSWGPRWILFLLPAVSIGLYVVLTAIARVPHRLNVPWEITEVNAVRTYRVALSLLGMLKAEVTIMFAYITWQTIRAACEQVFALGKFFLLVVVATILTTIVVHILAAYRAR